VLVDADMELPMDVDLVLLGWTATFELFCMAVCAAVTESEFDLLVVAAVDAWPWLPAPTCCVPACGCVVVAPTREFPIVCCAFVVAAVIFAIPMRPCSSGRYIMGMAPDRLTWIQISTPPRPPTTRSFNDACRTPSAGKPSVPGEEEVDVEGDAPEGEGEGEGEGAAAEDDSVPVPAPAPPLRLPVSAAFCAAMAASESATTLAAAASSADMDGAVMGVAAGAAGTATERDMAEDGRGDEERGGRGRMQTMDTPSTLATNTRLLCAVVVWMGCDYCVCVCSMWRRLVQTSRADEGVRWREGRELSSARFSSAAAHQSPGVM